MSSTWRVSGLRRRLMSLLYQRVGAGRRVGREATDGGLWAEGRIWRHYTNMQTRTPGIWCIILLHLSAFTHPLSIINWDWLLSLVHPLYLGIYFWHVQRMIAAQRRWSFQLHEPERNTTEGKRQAWCLSASNIGFINYSTLYPLLFQTLAFCYIVLQPSDLGDDFRLVHIPAPH